MWALYLVYTLDKSTKQQLVFNLNFNFKLCSAVYLPVIFCFRETAVLATRRDVQQMRHPTPSINPSSYLHLPSFPVSPISHFWWYLSHASMLWYFFWRKKIGSINLLNHNTRLVPYLRLKIYTCWVYRNNLSKFYTVYANFTKYDDNTRKIIWR